VTRSIPTDRGIVYVRTHADGTRSVLICCGVEGGRPVHVFAIHSRAARLDVDPLIDWEAPDPRTRYTTRMAIVRRADDGTVAIEAPTPDAGPLMALLEG